MIVALSLLIGVIAGLRAMTAPAAVSWAAYLGWLPLAGTALGFLAHPVAAYLLGALAIFELITDQLPKTPSRKVPVQFGTRVVMGAVCGMALALPSGMLAAGLIAGIVGAVIGTYGGAAGRARLAQAFGRDLPAALIEDVIAVGGALLIVTANR